MKNLINNIAWSGLILSLLFTIGCSKKNNPQPQAIQQPINNTNSIQRYVLITTNWANTEQDTIYLVNETHLTSPLADGYFYHDTLSGVKDINNFYNFQQSVNNSGTWYKGNWSITASNSIIKVVYNRYSAPGYSPNDIIHAYSSTYTKL